MIKLLIGVVAAAFVVIIGFLIIDPNVNNNANSIINSSSSLNTTTITIEGEVNKPGTYTLESGATMSDLINVAGGITSIADERCYFLDSYVYSGKSYYIAPLYDVNDICNTQELAKVNINKDSSDQLIEVGGISASVASSIVSHRSENGQFLTLENLLDVYGIGNATYKKIRNYVILHEWYFYSF